MFRQASLEERKIYYSEEWKIEDVPDYILDSLSKREFGFDHDGTGPKDRYNKFDTPDALADFLKKRAPYAAYCSVSFYERPEKREGGEEAELVFDIDAKELTLKLCCKEVCEKCLDKAKKVTMEVIRILKEDLALEKIYTSYSGRGYHIRVQDEDIMPEGAEVRANIFDFLKDRLYQPLEMMMIPPALEYDKDGEILRVLDRTIPFSKLTIEMMIDIIERGEVELLEKIQGIGKAKASKIFENKDKILDGLKKYYRVKELKKVIGPTGTVNFIKEIYLPYVTRMDAKVTVDTKRILRLPSSLHSKISMKCVEVKDLENFDPWKDAVPNFASEEK